MRSHGPTVLLLTLLLGACATMERSASKDPMKCERNPECARQQGKTRDCYTQCSDDPACVDRCREGQVDRAPGHP